LGFPEEGPKIGTFVVGGLNGATGGKGIYTSALFSYLKTIFVGLVR
jgi:hypothetical protein